MPTMPALIRIPSVLLLSLACTQALAAVPAKAPVRAAATEELALEPVMAGEFALQAGKLAQFPKFLQFPDDHLLGGRRTLVVDDVWGSGRTITAVKSRVEGAGGFPELCVLHYNPGRTLFTRAQPTYYAAVTDAHIVYPWEIDRGGPEGVLTPEPESN